MHYCEQAIALTSFEPLNAWSNLGFIGAAIAGHRYAHHDRLAAPAVRALLVGLAVAIGLGSFAWHATHQTWAELADVLPILGFVLVFLFHGTCGLLGYSRGMAGGICCAMLFAIIVCGARWPHAMNGSLAYLPVLLGLGSLAYLMPHAVLRRELATATALFALSLIFRSVDREVCRWLPLGTHWLWHVLNSCVIFLVIKMVVDARIARDPPAPHSR